MPALQKERRLGEDPTGRTSRRRFTLDVTHSDHAAVVTLAGELDVLCADAFKRRFAEAADEEPENVVIDLRDLTFIDSTGLALLLRVRDMSQDVGFGLWIVSAPEDPAQKIFRMTGTNTILPLVEELPDFAGGAVPRIAD